jgi:hypothetical protein
VEYQVSQALILSLGCFHILFIFSYCCHKLQLDLLEYLDINTSSAIAFAERPGGN